MRIAVICEFSGIVRDAFIKAGYEAVSYDLLPSESNLGYHVEGDVMQIPYDIWPRVDLAICHPPCTHLAVSGARWFKDKYKEQREALDFVQWLMDLPIERICIKNPVSIISTRIRKPDQIIQPYMFGHPESKKTCLWLKGLPLLKPTNILPLPECGHWNNQTAGGQNKLIINGKWIAYDDKKTQHERSRTYQGIAYAMAEQWGNL